MLIQDYYIDGEFDWEGFYDECAEQMEREIGIIAETDITNRGMRIALKNSLRRSGSLWVDYSFNKDTLDYNGSKMTGKMVVEANFMQDIQLNLSDAETRRIIDRHRSDWDDIEIHEDSNGLPMELACNLTYEVDLYPINGSAPANGAGQAYASEMSIQYEDIYKKAFDLQSSLAQH